MLHQERGVVWYGVLWCGVLGWCGVVWGVLWGVVQCRVMSCCVVPCCVVLCCVLWRCVPLWCARFHSVVLCCAVPPAYDTILSAPLQIHLKEYPVTRDSSGEAGTAGDGDTWYAEVRRSGVS